MTPVRIELNIIASIHGAERTRVCAGWDTLLYGRECMTGKIPFKFSGQHFDLFNNFLCRRLAFDYWRSGDGQIAHGFRDPRTRRDVRERFAIE